LLFWLFSTRSTNTSKQDSGGLIIRVLRYKFTTEGLRQDGLVELREKMRCTDMLSRDFIEPCESFLNPADYFVLFRYFWEWNLERSEFHAVYVMNSRR